ncbi:MAG: hypothetical protein Tsb0015_17390 [Simkaniaceae bacterium]
MYSITSYDFQYSSTWETAKNYVWSSSKHLAQLPLQFSLPVIGVLNSAITAVWLKPESISEAAYEAIFAVSLSAAAILGIRKYAACQEVYKIKEILRCQYGDESNPFHQEVTNLWKICKLSQLQEIPKDDFLKAVNNPALKTCFPSIYADIKLFKEEFRNYPIILEKWKIEETLQFIEKLMQEYDIPIFSLPLCDYSYKVIERSPQEFQGKRIVIGCGHKFQGCGGHFAEDYLIDISQEMQPDLIADYFAEKTKTSDKIFWELFQKESMQEIFLEGFGPQLKKYPLMQMSDILKTGGRLRYSIDKMHPAYALYREFPQVLKSYFASCGFKDLDLDEAALEIVAIK